MELCEIKKTIIGSSIMMTATADEAPARAIPPAAMEFKTDGNCLSSSL